MYVQQLFSRVGEGGEETLLSDVYHHSDGLLIRPLEDNGVGYNVNVIPLRMERYDHMITQFTSYS